MSEHAPSAQGPDPRVPRNGLSHVVGATEPPLSDATTGEFLADDSHARRSLEQSMQRLWRETIDVMQVHSLVNVDQILPVLRNWKREGRIRYFGVTHHELPYFNALTPYVERGEVDFVQVHYSIHTRLAEVTPLLQRDSAAVQEKVNAVTAGFGGGTRIATSVQDFHRVHARAQLGRSARVWILSDGFDADEPERLADELRAVRGRGGRITWFHPSPNPPASGAIERARPLIDRFVRLNSLSDLEQAAAVLH